MACVQVRVLSRGGRPVSPARIILCLWSSGRRALYDGALVIDHLPTAWRAVPDRRPSGHAARLVKRVSQLKPLQLLQHGLQR